MASGPSPEETVAAAQAMLAEITRHLADTSEVLRTQFQTLQEIAALHEREREEDLYRFTANQVQRARMEPGLPATEVPLDPAVHFSRQVWRRRTVI